MFCHQCGNKLTDDAKFCGKCGSPLLGASTNITEQVKTENADKHPLEEAANNKIPVTPPRDTTIQKIALAFWGVIIFVAVAIIIAHFWNGPASSTDNQISTTTAQTTDTPPMPDNQNSSQSTIQNTPDLPALVKEWQKSTAYVECYWDNPSTGLWYEKESGSGLLVMFTSGLTVITNRHVVDNSQYGVATECDVGFHDDNGVFYSVTTADQPAHYIGTYIAPDVSAHGNITFNSDGTDVANLSGLKALSIGGAPTISLSDRAKTGHFSCDTTSTGESIVILGYPDYGAGAGTYTSVFSNLSITATEGIISGQDGIYLTTSAKLDPGNSGGVAIDENNDCYVGIPTAVVVGSMSSLGRIIPASYVVK